MKKYVVREESSLKDFTDNVCAQASFCFRALLKNKEIKVNGKKTGENILLRAGDEVCYYLTKAQEEKTSYTVLYEDESILVADKESGVHSEAVFSSLCERGETYFIHRLDRNTSGLIAFAKTKEAEQALKCAFSERRAEKVYHAIVAGTMPRPRDVLRAYLQKDADKAFVRISASPRGEEIITEYETLENRGETSLIKVILHTGKTHQIRAHLAYIGNPVLGDEKYGNRALNRKYGATRQRLLAKELSFSMQGKFSYLNGITFLSPKNL